jgi:hypothetical protein
MTSVGTMRAHKDRNTHDEPEDVPEYHVSGIQVLLVDESPSRRLRETREGTLKYG